MFLVCVCVCGNNLNPSKLFTNHLNVLVPKKKSLFIYICSKSSFLEIGYPSSPVTDQENLFGRGTIICADGHQRLLMER